MNKYEQIKAKLASLLKSKDDRIKELEAQVEKEKAEPKSVLNLNVQELRVPSNVGIDGPVEIKNFPKPVTEMSIKNLPKVQEVEVKNFPEFPKFPEHPTEMKINNLPEVQKVEVINQPDKDYMPKWMPDLLTTFLKGIINGIDKITNKVFTVRLSPDDRRKALYVIPIDHEGNIIDFKGMGNNQPIFYPAGGSSSNGGTGGGTEGGALETTQQSVLTNLLEIAGKVGGLPISKTAVEATATGTVLTPASGKKLRIYGLKFSLDADLSEVSFNFDGDSAFEQYLSPKSGGLYGSNNHPDYFEGDIDQALEVYIDGTGRAAINIDYIEV